MIKPLLLGLFVTFAAGVIMLPGLYYIALSTIGFGPEGQPVSHLVMSEQILFTSLYVWAFLAPAVGGFVATRVAERDPVRVITLMIIVTYFSAWIYSDGSLLDVPRPNSWEPSICFVTGSVFGGFFAAWMRTKVLRKQSVAADAGQLHYKRQSHSK